MPDGVSGRELSRRLQTGKAHLKVSHTSGRSQEIAGHDFPLHEGENFLARQFQAAKLAKVLDARLNSGSSAGQMQFNPTSHRKKFLKIFLERRWIWRDVMTQTVRRSEPRSLKNKIRFPCVVRDARLNP